MALRNRGHIGKGYARLSKLQKMGPQKYARNVIDRILSQKGHWAARNVLDDVYATAVKIDKYLLKTGRVKGIVMNFDYVLDAAKTIVKVLPWK